MWFLDGCVQPEHRGRRITSHDQGPWPARQFGHLDGRRSGASFAGWAFRSILALRGRSPRSLPAADWFRSRRPSPPATSCFFRRASGRRHLPASSFVRRCPARGAMVRLPTRSAPPRDFTLAPAMSAPASAHCCCRASSAPTIGAHFLWLGVIALVVAAWYLWRGKRRQDHGAARTRCGAAGDLRGMVFVWTRYKIAIAFDAGPMRCRSAWKSR